jgi:hypothetical protein
MPKANPPGDLKVQLHKQGFTDDMIKEIWKWYDHSEKKGVASY